MCKEIKEEEAAVYTNACVFVYDVSRIEQCVRVIQETSVGVCEFDDNRELTISCQVLNDVPPPERSRESDRGLRRRKPLCEACGVAEVLSSCASELT